MTIFTDLIKLNTRFKMGDYEAAEFTDKVNAILTKLCSHRNDYPECMPVIDDDDLRDFQVLICDDAVSVVVEYVHYAGFDIADTAYFQTEEFPLEWVKSEKFETYATLRAATENLSAISRSLTNHEEQCRVLERAFNDCAAQITQLQQQLEE